MLLYFVTIKCFTWLFTTYTSSYSFFFFHLHLQVCFCFHVAFWSPEFRPHLTRCFWWLWWSMSLDYFTTYYLVIFLIFLYYFLYRHFYTGSFFYFIWLLDFSSAILLNWVFSNYEVCQNGISKSVGQNKSWMTLFEFSNITQKYRNLFQIADHVNRNY